RADDAGRVGTLALTRVVHELLDLDVPDALRELDEGDGAVLDVERGAARHQEPDRVGGTRVHRAPKWRPVTGHRPLDIRAVVEQGRHRVGVPSERGPYEWGATSLVRVGLVDVGAGVEQRPHGLGVASLRGGDERREELEAPRDAEVRVEPVCEQDPEYIRSSHAGCLEERWLAAAAAVS